MPAFHENPPLTPDALHAWISTHLGVTMTTEPMVEGHSAPFDYLAHAFFSDQFLPEGGGAESSRRWGAEPPSTPAPETHTSERSDATCDSRLASHASPPDRPLPSSPAPLLSCSSPSPSHRLTPSPSHPLDSVIWANRGGGKTFLGAIATLLDLVFKPGIEIRILGGSLDQSKRMYAHLRRFFDPFDHPDLASLIKGNMTERRLTLNSGSTVELLAQSQTSVRGTRVQKLRCDEADLFSPQIWEAAQLTTRSERRGQWYVRATIECLSTMHIPHGLMHDLVKEANQGKRRLFKWGALDVLEPCPQSRPCNAECADSPPGEASAAAPDAPVSCSPAPLLTCSSPSPSHRLTVSPSQPCPLYHDCRGRAKLRRHGHLRIDDAITQKSRISLAAWEAEMLSLRPHRSNIVVQEFKPKLHVFTDDRHLHRPPLTWLVGMDPGFRRTVILWAALDAADTLHILDEYSVADRILDHHIEALRRGLSRPGIPAWPQPAWIGIDISAEQRNAHTGDSTIQILRRAGFQVRDNSLKIRPGLELLRARFEPALGPPRLFIHERCKSLIESLDRYHFEDRKPESETPVKDGHDHAVDALRYLVANLDRAHRTTTSNYATA